MKIIANDIRPGNVLNYNKRLWAVSKISHTQPGKGGAFVQVEMKDIKSGTKLNERFRSSEDVEKAFLDTIEYQFLYKDGGQLVLMDVNSYEQVNLDQDLVGDPVAFLKDEMMVSVVSYEGNPIAVELPEEVTVEITEADAVVKGQTATSSYKPAVLENGVKVMVPQFIGSGEKIVVKTADGAYVKRVSE